VDLQSMFMEKWPYKIAAIVLSVLVWLNVTANRETQGRPISTRLEVEVQDSAWAISDVQAEVTTIFQGRSGDIVALMNAPVLRASIESVEDSIVELTLDVEDVEYDRSLSVLATSVSPPRVSVRLEPRVVRMVPVLPMNEATPEDGFAVARTLVLPDSIRLSGPASAVEPVVAVATERLDLGQIRETVTRTVGLQAPEGPPSMTLQPEQVTLTVEVDSLIVRRFQLTVLIAGDGAAGVAVDPPVVVVDVTGAARIVASLAAADLSATVRIAGTLTAPQTSPVQIRLPAGVNVRAIAQPAEVTVTPPSAPERGSADPRGGALLLPRGLLR